MAGLFLFHFEYIAYKRWKPFCEARIRELDRAVKTSKFLFFSDKADNYFRLEMRVSKRRWLGKEVHLIRMAKVLLVLISFVSFFVERTNIGSCTPQ